MSAQAEQRFREALSRYRAGSRNAAASLCRAILGDEPDHSDARRLLAIILEETGQAREAIDLLQEVATAPAGGDGRILFSLGRMQAGTGAYAEALKTLERARDMDPGNHRIPLALGFCLMRMGRLDEAAMQYEAALAIKPKDRQALRGLGEILTRLTRFDDAIAAYRQAHELEPGDPVAQERLAGLYERTNRLQELDDVVTTGLQLRPGHPPLRYHRAVLLRRHNDLKGALAILEELSRQALPSDLERRVAFESARVLDRLGRFEEAFDRAGQGNRLTRRLAREAAPDAEDFGGWLDRVHQAFSSTRGLAQSGAAPGAVDHERIVFILGFPRSGTTLIDAMLDSRDDCQVYEERPFLDELVDELQKHGLSYPECVAGLDPEAADALRERYYRAANRFAERRPGTIIVDKNPLATPSVPLLHQVFPRAKYIFAARHPLDVCLSCYLYPFSPNSAMGECDTIEGIAEVYARTVRIWRHARRHLPMDAVEPRYESLVTDFEAQSRWLFDFLGIEWDEAVLEFGREGRRGAAPALRNYDRVNQGIDQSSRYRWRNYEKQLQPAVSLVAEAASHFGYDT